VDLFSDDPDVVQSYLPALPYDGGSGWSGSDTSQERAQEADASGATAARQSAALAFIDGAQGWGATWAEVAEQLGWHHGTASGALSNLHAAGRLVRLQERRGGSQVYVTPRHQEGRTEAPRRATAGTRLALDVLDQVDTLLARGQTMEARRIIATARTVLAT